MMWLPTALCAALAAFGLLWAWRAAWPPVVWQEYLAGIAMFAVATGATVVAGAEAARQSGLLP